MDLGYTVYAINLSKQMTLLLTGSDIHSTIHKAKQLNLILDI